MNIASMCGFSSECVVCLCVYGVCVCEFELLSNNCKRRTKNHHSSSNNCNNSNNSPTPTTIENIADLSLSLSFSLPISLYLALLPAYRAAVVATASLIDLRLPQDAIPIGFGYRLPTEMRHRVGANIEQCNCQ